MVETQTVSSFKDTFVETIGIIGIVLAVIGIGLIVFRLVSGL